MRPRFSIVIPTRNRHRTLKFALLTCLKQNFEDYEIIVCDNYSSPETRETVESFESKKIKYIRSDRPLAMSQNWELAISHANGEFVTFIGDDDGLLPNALSKIEQLLKILNIKALHWQWIYYTWPDIPLGKNRLIIPVVRKNRILQSCKVLPRVANHNANYSEELPMIYSSVIHRDLIELLRKKTGGIFTAINPDIYSGVAFAYLAQSYASIGIPLGIAGISASGTGQNSIRGKDNSIAQEFWRLNAEAKLEYNPKIPKVPVISAAVADSVQHANEILYPNDNKISINRKRLVQICLIQLRSRYISGVDNEADWQIYLAKIGDSLADDRKLARWFEKKFGNSSVNDISIGWFDKLKRLDKKIFTPISSKSRCIGEYECGFDGINIVLDASDFGLKNVFDVAEFCEKFYSKNIYGLEWHGQGIKPDLLITVGKIRKLLGAKLSNF